MTPSPSPAARLMLVSEHARLPGAGLLLDPDRLSALLGREVTIDRVRIKPASGVLISYHAADSSADGVRGRNLADVGWVQLVDSRDKRDGILRRAVRGGIEVEEHPEAIREAAGTGASQSVPHLLSGGLDSDPRLGREIHAVLRRLSSGAAPRVLSYNPGRHVVLMLPDSGEVLRVAGRPLDHLQQVSRQWQELGLPTTVQECWNDRAAVLVSDHWGRGDLAEMREHAQARAAAASLGGVIARLHAADVDRLEVPSARIGATVPATTDAAADLLPHRAAQIRRLSQRLHEEIGAQGAPVLIHGDLSPDQVLLAPAPDPAVGPALPAPEIRVVDLDRSGLGPRSADLGSWLAACLLIEDHDQAEAFLAGYAQRLSLPAAGELAAWTARALLSAALDPMRRYSENWLGQVEQRLDLATAVLDRPEQLPLPRSASATGTDIAGSSGSTGSSEDAARMPLVPAHVEHCGRRLRVLRAWADDGRGLPLELEDEQAPAGQHRRAGRLDATTGEVTVFDPGTDPRLPALARVLSEQPDGVIVSHRPGKRAVVRRTDARGHRRYVKIVRRGRIEKLLTAVTRAESFDGPFRTARVLAFDEETVTFAELPGELLHEGLPTEGGTWRRAWRESLQAWAEAVETSRTRPEQSEGNSPAEIHGPAEEAALLERWRERADAVDPAGAPARERAVEAALSELGRLPAVQRPALIHRDLHDKQILWQEGEGPALLDVDTATLGDPGLDAANLRAHATWRELQGTWSAEQSAVVREEVDRAAGRAGIAPQTLAAYESGTMARLACVYAFRPQWRRAASELAASLVPAGPAGQDGPGEAGPAAADPGISGHGGHVEPSRTASPSSSPACFPAAGPLPPTGGTATPLERSMSR